MHQNGPVLVLVAHDGNFDTAPGELTTSTAERQRQPRRRPLRLRTRTTSCCAPPGARTGASGGYARMSLDYAAEAVIESYGVMI